ncbi:MAG TPA: 4Fe-4S dicluster domain-containing protein [Bryobacteraceae bacterium]|nr:4Fe-4S dicluster domain-containing protein [Bryobacteraceae bacterium]
MMQAAILTDTTKCIGCSECALACHKANHLAHDVPRRWDLDDGLSARNWTYVVEPSTGKYVRKQCRHCLQPACASACPVGALTKTALGPVVYDSSKCMGCRYCMMACPFGIPRYTWDQPVPYVRKCNLCYDRLQAGGQPACTEACPAKATIFGDRAELIAEARRRIREQPGRYVPKVWGEEDAGGTSVLYISDIDLSFLSGNHTLDPTPLPERTSLAMHAVPFAFVGVLGGMAGLNWIIRRRMKLQEIPEEAGHE